MLFEMKYVYICHENIFLGCIKQKKASSIKSLLLLNCARVQYMCNLLPSEAVSAYEVICSDITHHWELQIRRLQPVLSQTEQDNRTNKTLANKQRNLCCTYMEAQVTTKKTPVWKLQHALRRQKISYTETNAGCLMLPWENRYSNSLNIIQHA